MSERAEGSATRHSGRARIESRLLLAALLLPLATLAACANASSAESATRVAVETGASRPEQVVQRIEPAPSAASADSNAPQASTTSPLSGAAVSGAAVSGAAMPGGGLPRVAATARDKHPLGEAITAKHLEAELNRLEAELK